MLLGILPNVPGFLVTVNLISKDAVWPWVSDIYHYAWFAGFIVSGLAYMLLSGTRINEISKDYNEMPMDADKRNVSANAIS